MSITRREFFPAAAAAVAAPVALAGTEPKPNPGNFPPACMGLVDIFGHGLAYCGGVYFPIVKPMESIVKPVEYRGLDWDKIYGTCPTYRVWIRYADYAYMKDRAFAEGIWLVHPATDERRLLQYFTRVFARGYRYRKFIRHEAFFDIAMEYPRYFRGRKDSQACSFTSC